MDMTIGQTLEKSFQKDQPRDEQNVGNRVVSKPAPQVKPVTPSKPKAHIPQPRAQEKRYTIESVPEDGSPQLGTTKEEQMVNSQSLQHLLLLRHFGIEGKPTQEEILKLKTIWDFVKADSPEKTVTAIIRLRNKLGTNSGDSPLDKVFRHVQIRKIHQYEQV